MKTILSAPRVSAPRVSAPRVSAPRASAGALLALLALLALACDPRAGGGGGASPSDISSPPADLPAPAADEPVEALTPSLWVETRADGAGRVRAEVRYARRADQAAPRAVELFVEHPSSLAYIGAEPLEAAVAAGKELVVQRRDATRLRVVLMSPASLALIGGGGLAALSFEGALEEGAAVRIVPRAPYFAPAEANEGVVLAPPSSALTSGEE